MSKHFGLACAGGCASSAKVVLRAGLPCDSPPDRHAVEVGSANSRSTQWISVLVFGPSAPAILQYKRKGDEVSVLSDNFEAKNEKYQTRDGQDQEKVKVTVFAKAVHFHGSGQSE